HYIDTFHLHPPLSLPRHISFFFHSPPPPALYPLSLHDALPIFPSPHRGRGPGRRGARRGVRAYRRPCSAGSSSDSGRWPPGRCTRSESVRSRAGRAPAAPQRTPRRPEPGCDRMSWDPPASVSATLWQCAARGRGFQDPSRSGQRLARPTDHRCCVNTAELTRANSLITSIPSHPEPRVVFRDISPLLADGPAMRAVTEALIVPFAGGFDIAGGLEAR